LKRPTAPRSLRDNAVAAWRLSTSSATISLRDGSVPGV
jgi:hypothetical protein